MKMKILYFFTIISFFFINCIYCSSEDNLNSIKNGVSKINEIGNSFFNIIRGRFDPDKIDFKDFKDFQLSFDLLMKGSRYYLSYYILVAIGITLAILMFFIGLIFLCCRCCGKCGGKEKAMDPKHATCKRITYGIFLLLFCTIMLFGIIFASLNNYVIHEIMVNEDKSVNIFLNLKSDFNNINKALTGMNESIYKSKPAKLDPKKMAEFSKDLANNIQKFYLKLVQVPELDNVIQKVISLKRVLDLHDTDKSRAFIYKVNSLLDDQRDNLGILKNKIKFDLLNCSTVECSSLLNKTEGLRILRIPQDVINVINETLDLLQSKNFQEGLSKIIMLKENNGANMDQLMEKQLEYIKDTINSSSFSNSVIKDLLMTIEKLVDIEKLIQESIPSPASQNTNEQKFYKHSKTFESYRFYCYIGICGVILVIISCYYLGLLFGNFGERATEDAGCCNRGVGAKFMISGVYLTFFFFSFFIVVVIGNMLTTGIANTDMCRYTGLDNKNNAKILDIYIKVFSDAANKNNIPYGIMDTLLNKCSQENIYSAFNQVDLNMISMSLNDNFSKIENNLVNAVLSQLNLSSLLNVNLFKSSATDDLQLLVNSIGLLNNDNEISTYIMKLENIPKLRDDANEVRNLNNKVIDLKKRLRLIIQYFNNSENGFIQLKLEGKLFENIKDEVVRSRLSQLLSSIKESLFNLISGSISEMFKDVECKTLRLGVLRLFNTICKDVIDPLNGVWYGIGFVLLLSIPSLLLALLLNGLFRRIQKYYPDKEEPDYDNYIGFYARADSEAFKNNQGKKPVHRGYKPIPLQQMS